MTKGPRFYKALQDVFIGAKIEGYFVNLMRIKSNYYRKIEKLFKVDIEKALEKYPTFRDELFDKLYSFLADILQKVDQSISTIRERCAKESLLSSSTSSGHGVADKHKVIIKLGDSHGK